MKKNDVLNIICFAFFKVILDKVYVNFIYPNFNYSGMYLDFNILKYFESWIIYFIISVIILRKKSCPIYLLLLILNFLLITPTLTLYGYQNRPNFDFYIMVLPYICLLLLINKKQINLKFIKNGRKISISLALISTLIVFFNYSKIVGIKNINFNFYNVYILRAKYDHLVNVNIFGYLNGWVTKVFNIFLICWSLKERKKIRLIFFILLQVYFFAISGHKGVLFSLIIVFILYFIEKRKYKTTIVSISFIGLILGLILYYKVTEKIMLPSILIRRLFFIPSYLNYTYLEFFKKNEYIYWSNSIFKYIFKYAYSTNLNHLIGRYLGVPESGANTGIFGSGYAHLGIFGIIIYLIIIYCIIIIINSFKKIPSWFINILISLPFLTAFISSDLLTTLLTHGFLISIFLLYLYSGTDKK